MAEHALNEVEQEIIEKAGELWGLITQAIPEGPSRDADLREIMFHIHGIQRTFMAQAAARIYPDKLRGLGGGPLPPPPDNHIRMLLSNIPICEVPEPSIQTIGTITPTADVSDVCPECLIVLNLLGSEIKERFAWLRRILPTKIA